MKPDRLFLTILGTILLIGIVYAVETTWTTDSLCGDNCYILHGQVPDKVMQMMKVQRGVIAINEINPTEIRILTDGKLADRMTIINWLIPVEKKFVYHMDDVILPAPFDTLDSNCFRANDGVMVSCKPQMSTTLNTYAMICKPDIACGKN
jgi:hypothetical protein